MAAITVRALDPDVKQALRERASRRGRSMEAEARAILTAAVAAKEGPEPDSAAGRTAFLAELAQIRRDYGDVWEDGLFDGVRRREAARDPWGERAGDDVAG
jgi:plasmid stability protein